MDVAPPGLRRLAPWLAALLALAVALAPVGTLAVLLPLQRALLATLLPGFELERLSLLDRDERWTLQADARTHEHLVARAHVVAPGTAFRAGTPARQVQRQLALGLALAALCLARRRVAAALPALLLPLVAAPLVLAGQVWGLLLPPLSEPSWGAPCVALSDFLLRGGDLVLALLGPAVMVLSDHGRPWSDRTMRSPAAAGSPSCRPGRR